MLEISRRQREIMRTHTDICTKWNWESVHSMQFAKIIITEISMLMEFMVDVTIIYLKSIH